MYAMVGLSIEIVCCPFFIRWEHLDKKYWGGQSSFNFFASVGVASFILLLFSLYVSFAMILNLKKYMRTYYMEFRVKIWIQSLSVIITLFSQFCISLIGAILLGYIEIG